MSEPQVLSQDQVRYEFEMAVKESLLLWSREPVDLTQDHHGVYKSVITRYLWWGFRSAYFLNGLTAPKAAGFNYAPNWRQPGVINPPTPPELTETTMAAAAIESAIVADFEPVTRRRARRRTPVNPVAD